MSARRMPCKRCHHPRPVGTDGYCNSCAETLRQMKKPKSAPPSGPFEVVPCGANQMDAQGGPKCACGKPSVFEDGSCSDCAVDRAERVSSPVMAGDRVVPDERANAGVAGEGTAHDGPVTERSSKTPTLPPATEGSVANFPPTNTVTLIDASDAVRMLISDKLYAVGLFLSRGGPSQVVKRVEEDDDGMVRGYGTEDNLLVEMPRETYTQLLEEARNTRAVKTLLDAPPPEPESDSEPPDSMVGEGDTAPEAPAPEA